jgi:rubrerythrin
MANLWFYLDDEDEEDDTYDKKELDEAYAKDMLDLLEDEEDLELFEYKCKNCGAVMVEDGYCEVCGWFAGV